MERSAEKVSERASDSFLAQDLREIFSDHHISNTALDAKQDTLHSKEDIREVSNHLLEDGTFDEALESIINERITATPKPSIIMIQVCITTGQVRKTLTQKINQ